MPQHIKTKEKVNNSPLKRQWYKYVESEPSLQRQSDTLLVHGVDSALRSVAACPDGWETETSDLLNEPFIGEVREKG